MKRKTKPSDHLFLGMLLVTVEVGVTWYYYVKTKLKLRKLEDTKLEVVPGTESSIIPNETFEEELAASSASNGNGEVADHEKDCDCEHAEPIPPEQLSGVEEPESPVSSLPENPEPPTAEPESPEADHTS